MAQHVAASKAPKSVWEFDPTTISGCVLWLDGADRNTTVTTVGGSTPAAVGGAVAEWKDKSIMQNHASNPTLSSRPVLGNSRLIFNLSALQLANANLLPSGASDGTYFTVTEFQGDVLGPIIIHGSYVDSQLRIVYDKRVGGVREIGAIITGGQTYNGVNPVDINGTIDNQNIHITTLTVNNLIGSLWASGNLANNTNVDLQNTATAVNTGNTTATIGIVIGQSVYRGNIYEILVYNSALSNTDRQIVEGYLALKWGIHSQLPTNHPYKNTFRPMSRNFVPTDIYGCQLWLDPADSATVTLTGSNVTTIIDKSGLGNNATNASSTITYTSTLNGLPVLTFPDANSSLSTPAITRNPVKRTYFFVIKYSGTVSNSTHFIQYGTEDYFRHNGSSSQVKTLDIIPSSIGSIKASQTYSGTGFDAATATAFYGNNTFILACVRDREKYTFSTNGESVEVTGNSVGDESTGSSYIVTASNQGHLVGDVIIYNSALTKLEIQQVEGYLLWKWGVRRQSSLKIPIPVTHPYYNFPSSSQTPKQPELLLYKNEFDPADLSPVVWIDPQDNSKITKDANNRLTEIKNKGRLNLPFIKPTSIDGPLVTTNASRTGIGQQFLDFSNGGNYRVTAATVESNLTTLTLTVSPPHNGAIPEGKFVNLTCITGTYPGGSSATRAIGPFQILSASVSSFYFPYFYTILYITTISNHGIVNNQNINVRINEGTFADGSTASGFSSEFTTNSSGNSGTQLQIIMFFGSLPDGLIIISDGHVRNNVGTSGPYLTQAGTAGSTVKLTSYSNRSSTGSLANFTGHIEYGQIPFTSARVLISPLRLSIRTPINHGLSSGAGIGLCSNNNFCLPFQTSIPATNPLNAAAIQFTNANITSGPAQITITVTTNPFFIGSVASPTYVGVNSIQLRLLTGTTYSSGTNATGLTVSTTTAAGSNSTTIVLSITSASPVAGNLTFTGGPGILYSGTGNSSFINGTVTTTSGTSGNTINCNITGTPPLANSGLLIKTSNPVFSSDDPIVRNSCILSPVKGFALENTTLGTALNTNQMTIIWASCLTNGYYRNNFSNANIQSSVISAAVTIGGTGGADTTSFRIQTSSNGVGTSRMSIIRGGTGGAVSPALVPGGRILTDTTSHFRINHAIMNLSGTAVDDIPANTHAIATNGWGYASQFANSALQATAGSQTATTLAPTHLRIGANTGATGDYVAYPLTSHWYEGGLGDIMIFNSVLTFEQRKLVEGYIAEKYRCQEYLGGTSNSTGQFLHPYRTTSTRVLPSLDLTKTYAQGLTVWFDAANSSTIVGTGTDVDSWTSSGGNLALTLTAVDNKPQLVENVQNGLPGIRFTVTGGNGRPLRGPFTSKLTNFTTISENNEYTIITVYRTAVYEAGAVISCLLRGGGTNDRLVINGNNFNYRGSPPEASGGIDQSKFYSATATNTMYITVHYRRGNVMSARVNGSVDSATMADLSIPPAVGILDNFGLILGSYLGPTNGPFAGDIYEHIMFRYALTDQAIFQIEGYLAWKWGVNGSLPATHPYYEVMT